MINLLDQTQRQTLIRQIDTETNKARKQMSLRQFEIQSGRIEQYVQEALRAQFDEASVKEMPLVSSINIQKRIVQKKSTIYKRPADRDFSDISEEQEAVVKQVYKDMKADVKLGQSNKGYVYQDQSIGMIVPKDGKLIMRVFKMHQIDVIPSAEDPETAEVYIISAFDRENYEQLWQDKKEINTATGAVGRSMSSSESAIEGEHLEIANAYDYKRNVEKYIVWSNDYNFAMNGLGEVVDPLTWKPIPFNEEDIKSPLAEHRMTPFFEVSKDKDFEYFVRSNNALTDFTIQFNSRLSDEGNVIKMNGYAVAVLKAPSDLQPESQIIGASMLLKLPTDNLGQDAEVDFQFVSPSSSIGEISAANEKFLNYFVTTEGLGSDVANATGSSEKFSSGLDRFISMVDRVEAHSEDYEAYRDVESQVWKIVKAWMNTLSGTDTLNSRYNTTPISDDSEIRVEFYRPEVVQTESDKLATIEKKMDLGLMSEVEAIAHMRGIDIEEARIVKKEIERDNNGDTEDSNGNIQTEVLEE